MKKTIKFSKLFGLMVVVSCALVISGIVGLFTKGINFGIDFQAGFIEKVRFAPSAFILTYNGEKNIQVAQNSQGIDVTVISVDTENKVISFKYTDYPTVGQFIEAIRQQVDGIKAAVLAKADTPLQSVFITSETSRVTADPFRAHYIPDQIHAIDDDAVRQELAYIH